MADGSVFTAMNWEEARLRTRIHSMQRYTMTAQRKGGFENRASREEKGKPSCFNPKIRPFVAFGIQQ